MAIAHVTGGGGHIGNIASAATLALTVQAVGTGNLVCGVVTYGSAGTLSNVKDNAGTPNTYTLGNTVTDATDSYKATAFYLSGITGNPTIITATFAAGVTFRGIACDEYSGVATSSPLDIATQQDQTGITGTANAITSGLASTLSDGDLIYGATVTGGVTTAVTAGTSPNAFTLRQTDRTASNEFMYTEDFIVQTTHGSIAATFTGSTTGDDYATFILAFKAAAAAAGIPLPAMNLSVMP